MKILYFRLKGYAGLFHGSGLNEIEIPFYQFTNNIILLCGINGSGKSTIMNALSIDIDSSSDYRVDRFMDMNGRETIIQYPAEKEIHLQDDFGNIYKILIQSNIKSNGERDTTKAFISKNDEELNIKGNVGLFKDIRDDLLNIDSTSIKLSMVSSENRGLVDKTPSDRKIYVNNVLGNLEYFNELYRTLTKKTSKFKDIISGIRNKLYNLGDEESLRSSLINCKNRLDLLKTTRDELLKKLSSAQTTISILDPSNEIQDLCDRIINDLGIIKINLNKYVSEYDSILKRYKISPNIDIDGKLEDISSKLQSVIVQIESDSKELSYVINSNDDSIKKLEELNMQLNSLTSSDIEDDIDDKICDLENKIGSRSKYIIDTGSISLNRLYEFKDSLYSVHEGISVLREKYYHGMIADAYVYNDTVQAYGDINKLRSLYNDINNGLNNDRNRILSLKNELNTLSSDIEKGKNVCSMRPKNCKIDSCPFLTNASKDKIKEYEKKYKIKNKELEELNKSVSENEALLESIQSSIDISIDVVNMYNKLYPLLEYNILKDICINIQSCKMFFKCIVNHNMFNEFKIIDDIISKYTITQEVDIYKTELDRLLSVRDIRYKDIKLRKYITDNIEKESSNISKYTEKIKCLQKSVSFNTELKSELERTVSIYKELSVLKSNISLEKDNKSKLSDTYIKVKDDISKVKSALNDINTIQHDIDELDKSIQPLMNDIANIEYNLANVIEYKNDLNIALTDYDKLEFLKRCSSPTNGIQTMYISIFFNKILGQCNELLSYLFGGRLRLVQPIISEKEFSIPFVNDSNSIIPDISYGSTSQRCMVAMILSFVLLGNFDVIRLDEIDGGLDTENRSLFITVLWKLMEIKNVKQCIMISHNIELEEHSVTKITVTPAGLIYN